MEDVKVLLKEEIVSEIGELNAMKVGSDEYKIATEGIVKLMDRSIEMDKIQRDQNNQQSNHYDDYLLKVRQVDAEIRDRKVKNIITAVTSGLGTAVTVWGVMVAMGFEYDGKIFSTIVGRNFINRIFNKK